MRSSVRRGDLVARGQTTQKMQYVGMVKAELLVT
jgi:hypothetical protein